MTDVPQLYLHNYEIVGSVSSYIGHAWHSQQIVLCYISLLTQTKWYYENPFQIPC